MQILFHRLETLSKPTLKILFEYIFGNLEEYLKKESHKEQYKSGFEAILQYLRYTQSDIENHLTNFINGTLPGDLGTKIDEMKKDSTISFPEPSLFQTSLEDILKQSEF